MNILQTKEGKEEKTKQQQELIVIRNYSILCVSTMCKWTLVDQFRSTAVSTVKWRKTRSFGSGECRGNIQVSSTYPFHHQVGSYNVEAMMAVPSFYGLLSP